MITIAATGLLCLSLTVYHEARSADLKGQRAVAAVVMNRAEGDPDLVCAEVFRYRQFSWANDRAWLVGKQVKMLNRMIPRERAAWKTARRVALLALTGAQPDPTKGATHYHTPAVAPKWGRSFKLTKIGMFGPHIFYKPSGYSVIADYNARVSITKSGG